MKKNLVAIAALAAATGAMAQSSVTLYGALDAGYTGVQYNKGNGDSVQRQGVAWGANDTSRWGFTGKDDIGGGLTSEFKIESQIGSHPRGGLGGTGISTNGGASIKDFTMDGGIAGQSSGVGNGGSSGYGTDNTVLGNRELWVALNNASSGTTLKVGFGTTALRQLSVETDASGSNNYGNLIGHVVGGFRRSGIRVDQTFNGTLTASVEAFGSAQKTQQATNVANGDVLVTKGYTANLQYKQGPINAGIGYDTAAGVNPAIAANAAGTGFQVAATTGNAAAAANNVTNTTMAGASYDLGKAKLFAQAWSQTFKNNLVATNVGQGKWYGESVGVRVPVGQVTYFGQYYMGKNAVGVTSGTDESRKVTGPSAGLRYDLSKRTYTYLNAGYLKTVDSSAGSDSLKFKQTSAGLVTYF